MKDGLFYNKEQAYFERLCGKEISLKQIGYTWGACITFTMKLDTTRFNQVMKEFKWKMRRLKIRLFIHKMKLNWLKRLR